MTKFGISPVSDGVNEHQAIGPGEGLGRRQVVQALKRYFFLHFFCAHVIFIQEWTAIFEIINIRLLFALCMIIKNKYIWFICIISVIFILVQNPELVSYLWACVAYLKYHRITIHKDLVFVSKHLGCCTNYLCFNTWFLTGGHTPQCIFSSKIWQLELKTRFLKLSIWNKDW